MTGGQPERRFLHTLAGIKLSWRRFLLQLLLLLRLAAAVRPSFESDEQPTVSQKVADAVDVATPLPPDYQDPLPLSGPSQNIHIKRLNKKKVSTQAAPNLDDMLRELDEASPYGEESAKIAGRRQMCMFLAQGETDLSTGTLTAKGLAMVKQRMDILHTHYHAESFAWLDFITGMRCSMCMEPVAGVEEIWVAPDQGALATTLVVLAKAWVQRHLYELGGLSDMSMDYDVVQHAAFPVLRVVAHLRGPRVAWYKEGVEEHLRNLANALCNEYLPRNSAFRQQLQGAARVLAKQLREAEGHMTWWKKELTDVVEVYGNIHTIKRMLAWRDAKVLIIGHAELSTFMFAGKLVNPGEPSPTEPELRENLQRMSRPRVWSLQDAGILKAEWTELSPAQPPFVRNPDRKEVSYPYFEHVETYIPKPIDNLLPSRGWGHFESVPFDHAGFVGLEVGSHLPDGAHWWGPFAMRKRKKGLAVWSRWKDRIIYLVAHQSKDVVDASGNPPCWMTWLTPFGETLKGSRNIAHIQVEELDSQDGLRVLLLKGTKVEEEWELREMADTVRSRKGDNQRFYKAWKKLQRFRTGTAAAHQLAQEIDKFEAEVWDRSPPLSPSVMSEAPEQPWLSRDLEDHD